MKCPPLEYVSHVLACLCSFEVLAKCAIFYCALYVVVNVPVCGGCIRVNSLVQSA